MSSSLTNSLPALKYDSGEAVELTISLLTPQKTTAITKEHQCCHHACYRKNSIWSFFGLIKISAYS